ncbi:MAG: ankyrin repeat domain-containing protein [Pseudomonadota bacterium]
MLSNSFYKRSAGLAALIAFFFWFASASAAEFTADVNQRFHGTDLTGKIFVKGEKYRLEQQDDKERRMLIIVDQKANLTIVADSAEKNYMETPSQDMASLMQDPFQSARYMEDKHKKIFLGEEIISGFECRRLKFEAQSQEMMTVWKSKKLGFVLKITLPDKNKSFIHLKNIKEGPVDEVLFQVPAGYAKKEDPQKKREREETALHALTTTISGSAPLARRIGHGGEIRVKVDSKKSVRFKIENLIKEESVFTITAFRNNQPIKMDIEKTYSLKLKGRKLEPLLGIQNRADEVSVKVDKGKIIAGIMVEESSFAKDKINSFFIMTGIRDSGQGVYLDAGRLLRLSITSDSQDAAESRVKVSFYKGSYKDKIDEVEVVLKNGQAKSWEYPIDKGIKTLNIEVTKGGGVKVRIEQPASEKAATPKTAPKIVYTTPSKSAGKSGSITSRGKPTGFKLSKEQGKIINKAFNSNNIAAVEAELDNGMDIDSMLHGETLLMKASNIGTADMVKMLISRGANLNYRTKRGDDALSVAMSNSRHWTKVVPVLVEAGISIDEKTPIWKLAFKTKKRKLTPEVKKLLKLLFAKGASPDCYTGQQKTTVIMYYAKKGWLDPLQFFIDQGANVNARATDGQTALSTALTKPNQPENAAWKKERQDVVKLLRAKGAK